MKKVQSFNKYSDIIAVDTEYSSRSGEIPDVHCIVLKSLLNGEVRRYFINDDEVPKVLIKDSELMVAYYAAAEIGSFLPLNIEVPNNILDLFTEFRCHTNSGSIKQPASLLAALKCFGIESMESKHKDSMRELAIRGGPFTLEEKESLLDYCQEDVEALGKLFEAMKESIDWDRALIRGQYSSMIAVMEHNGIPIELSTFNELNQYWEDIRKLLVKKIDKEYNVYDGTTFKQSSFIKYIRSQGIQWPKLPSGRPDLSEDAFKSMKMIHPQVASLYELRACLSKMKKLQLAVGSDGRNRCMLSPFSSKTGRNQPSTNKFIFGLPSWMRSLIKPQKGKSLAYIDWSQQEFGIAAALSGDQNMKEAYHSGDPYLAFGKQAGVIPMEGTKVTHAKERDVFKTVVLAIQYGGGAKRLGEQLGKTLDHGKEYLRLHQKIYSRYWEWMDQTVSGAKFKKSITSLFGWKMKIDVTTGSRTIANFPCQANGAEMLRIAIIYCVDNGIKVCAPVHDAILIEADMDEIENSIRIAQECMRMAGLAVLDGFELKSDVEVIHYPDRYVDKRGITMWEEITNCLDKVRIKDVCKPTPTCSFSNRNMSQEQHLHKSNYLIGISHE